MPQIIPPSPDASAIGKFGEIPVNTYTGIPNITIPLYAVKVRDISLPISLSYHASGIRVEEEASWVGLGWALSAGGMVSRTVRGNDDLVDTTPGNETGYVYSQAIPEEEPIAGTDPIVTTLPFTYIQSVCQGGTDSQPDIFNFNFLGHSAKFFLKRKVNPSDPSEPIEVMFASEGDNYHVKYDESAGVWTIITPEGIKAVFATKEYSRTMAGVICSTMNGNTTCDPLVEPNPLSWEVGDPIITAWYLDALYSPTGEQISFEYDLEAGEGGARYVSRSMASVNESRSVTAYQLNCEETLKLYGKSAGITCNGPQDPGTAQGNPCADKPRSYSGSMTATWNVYLQRITFKNGELRFIKDTREDIEAHFTSDETFSPPQKLDKIEVYQNNQFVKSFDFIQTYYNDNRQQDTYRYKRLKLNQVVESSNGVSKKPYVFAYRGDNAIATFLPDKKDAARDHWGLYNGKTANNTAVLGRPALIPTLSYLGTDGLMRTVSGADRESDEESAMSGILEQVTYPTGGTSQIFYEIHQVSAEQQEGVQGEREYYLSTSSLDGHIRVFQITHPVEAIVNGDLKCPTLSCYPGGTGATACAFDNAMYLEGENYIEITNLETGERVYTARYSDYECKYFSSTTCPAGVHVTLCGVHRSDKITLDAGHYMLKTIPKFGLEAQSNISFKLKLNPFVQSELVNYKVGGLRVRKIVEHDGISTANDIVRKFYYTTQDSQGRVLSSGKLMSVPKYHYYQYFTLVSGENMSACTAISSSSSSNVPLGHSAQGSPVGYDRVTISYGENGENGYSVFEYKNEADLETDPFLPNSPTITHTASNGLLIKEAHFTRDRFKLKEVVNDYVKVSSESLPAVYTFSTNGCGTASDGTTAYKKYTENSEWWQLMTKTEKVFDVTDPANLRSSDAVTSYTYASTHKMLSNETTTTSEGKSISTHYTYPFDVQDPALKIMWDKEDPNYRHMQGIQVKVETYQGTGSPMLIAGTKNNYFVSPTHQLLLDNIQVAGTNGVYETRIDFQQYDPNGNLLQVRKSHDLPTSYLWSYNAALPVAQILNAESGQGYYEGFEHHPSGQNNRSEAHSGHKYLTGSFTIPFAIPDARTYELSYWKYLSNEWTCIKQPYTAPVTITGDRLDDVRIYPAGSQMTTYDYEPLTGLITSTDMNNQSTHYEYDELQRLIWVRDFEKNAVLGYKYVYRN